MDQKRVRLLMGIASISFFVLAVILFVFGIVYDNSGLAKVLLFVASVLVLILSLEIVYLFLLSCETKPNYFLFNPVINRNSSVEKLTFEIVDARMNKYLSAFADSEGKIWTERILDDPRVSIAPAFKPAVAYKLLFDISKFDNEAGWKCFVMSSPATVEFIARGIAQNGDREMANTLVQLKASKPLNMKHVRDYLVGNKKYIQRKLYKYVVENIDLF